MYFHAFDTDGNGKISFREFATALSILGPSSKEKKLRFLFSLYDEDQSTTLTVDEIDKLVQQMFHVAFAIGRISAKDAKFIHAIIRKLDTNGDHIISLEEWLREAPRIPSLLVFLGVIAEAEFCE